MSAVPRSAVTWSGLDLFSSIKLISNPRSRKSFNVSSVLSEYRDSDGDQTLLVLSHFLGVNSVKQPLEHNVQNLGRFTLDRRYRDPQQYRLRQVIW